MAYFIKLIDRTNNVAAHIAVYSGMGLEIVENHISETFDLKTRVVGIFDDEVGVFYPLSFLIRNPENFANRDQDMFSIVEENSSFMNSDEFVASSNVRQRVIDIEEEERRSTTDYDDDDSEEDEDTRCYVSETSDEAQIVSPSEIMTSFLENVPVEFIDAHLKMLIDEVEARTLLKQHTLPQLFHAFSLYADSSDRVSIDAFLASVGHLHMLDPPAHGVDSTFEGKDNYSAYERMFNAIKEFSIGSDDSAADINANTQHVSIYHVCLFLSLFSSPGSNDNDRAISLKIIYNLFDFNRDGFVTLSDAHNCFYMLIKCLLNLFPDVIFDIDDYPIEKVVSVLTESLFRGQTIGNGGNTILKFDYFQQWHRSRDNLVFLLVEAVQNPNIQQGLKSRVSSFQEARSELGLEGIAPMTLMTCLSHYASDKGSMNGENQPSDDSENFDDFQFISRRGVFAAILLASKMESASNVFSADWLGLYRAEVIVCELFALYDVSQAGYIDKNDIFAGLSVFCGNSFASRVDTMFSSRNNAKSQRIVFVSDGCSYFQSEVTRSEMIEYLLAVLKAVLLYGNHNLDDEVLQSLAVRMIGDALSQKTLPVQLNGSVPSNIFAKWLEVVINIKQDANVTLNGDDSATESTAGSSESDGNIYAQSDSTCSESSVSQEIDAVKRMMGFTGFTAEDLMDLLGEVSREGMISEFNWFQSVSNMCAFNSIDGEEDRMDEALLFAEKVFNSLAALYPAIVSESGERLVNYSLLLSTVTILCDCPAEDKMFTAFMMLSDSTMGTHPGADLNNPDEVTTFASVSNVMDYFRGVFSLLCAISPTVHELTEKKNLTPDQMAVATLQCTMAQNDLTSLPDRGFDLDQFCALAWTCMQM